MQKSQKSLLIQKSFFELVRIFAFFALFFFIVEYYLNRKMKKTIKSCIMFTNLTYLFSNK